MSKKTNTAGSVNVDAIKRDVKKMVGQYDPKPTTHRVGDKTFGELSPGTSTRQSTLEQDMGTSKYREMIHNHNNKNRDFLDKLPFTFPKKSKVSSHLNVMVFCVECGEANLGSENTFGAICTGCKKYNRMENPEKTNHNLKSTPGFLATADDILKAREK